jgi:hypothetical protein
LKKRKGVEKQRGSNGSKIKENSKTGKVAIQQPKHADMFSNLGSIQYAFSSDLTIADITAARKKFLTKFETLRVAVRKGNKSTPSTFNRVQATEITSYFFTAVLGSDLPRRISALATFYNSRPMESMDDLAGCRAMDPARNEETPVCCNNEYRRLRA